MGRGFAIVPTRVFSSEDDLECAAASATATLNLNPQPRAIACETGVRLSAVLLSSDHEDEGPSP